MGCTKDKIVLFFPIKQRQCGVLVYANLKSQIRKKVSENRPSIMNGCYVVPGSSPRWACTSGGAGVGWCADPWRGSCNYWPTPSPGAPASRWRCGDPGTPTGLASSSWRSSSALSTRWGTFFTLFLLYIFLYIVPLSSCIIGNVKRCASYYEPRQTNFWRFLSRKLIYIIQ